ncbi:hypothetical protein [Pseudonocardia sp. GCM10023141]|uniref:hypothetical protein n=1 Tax=Pseudonocardia sp. GCM10023141 TaxID=3252653 RepID=UPI003607C1CD
MDERDARDRRCGDAPVRHTLAVDRRSGAGRHERGARPAETSASSAIASRVSCTIRSAKREVDPPLAERERRRAPPPARA